MPSPFSPHRDASIPTLTQRAEPTLSPDAVPPPDDGMPVLGDVYIGPGHDTDEDVPVLSQQAQERPEPHTPWEDRAGNLPPQAPLPAAGPLAEHPVTPYPLDSGPPYPARPQMPGYRPPAAVPQAPPRYVPPVHPGLEPDLSAAPATPPVAAQGAPSASIPEAVLRAALQAEIEQAVHAAVQEASALLRTRLEAELPAIVARTLGRVRPG